MKQMPVRYRLPISHSTEIGRIITRWAHLEWVLSETLYRLIATSPKIGRLAVRETRIVEYLTIMEKTARLQGVTVSVDWKKFRIILQTMESFRNKLAHGVWIRDPSSNWPALRQVKGTYTLKHGARSVDARISPASLPVPFSELKNAVKGLDRANQIALDIKKEVEAQVTP